MPNGCREPERWSDLRRREPSGLRRYSRHGSPSDHPGIHRTISGDDLLSVSATGEPAALPCTRKKSSRGLCGGLFVHLPATIGLNRCAHGLGGFRARLAAGGEQAELSQGHAKAYPFHVFCHCTIYRTDSRPRRTATLSQAHFIGKPSEVPPGRDHFTRELMEPPPAPSRS